MPSITVLDSTGTTQTVQTIPAVGQAVKVASLPVVIASDQGVISTADSKLPAALGLALSVASLPVVIASDQALWPVTQPISVAALPLPTGASTDATLTAQSAKLPATLGAKAGAASLSIVAASDDYGRQPANQTNVILSAAATTNATSAKATAGAVKSIQGYNAKAAPVFLKLYNKASAPTVGTDTPVKTLYVPATSAFVFDFPAGYVFSAGIAYAMTGASAVTDTTALVAGDILCLNIDFI